MADRRTGKRVKVERTTVTNTKTLDELFQTFYEAKAAQGMTKRTLETYRENFRFLCDYLEMKMNLLIDGFLRINEAILR